MRKFDFPKNTTKLKTAMFDITLAVLHSVKDATELFLARKCTTF